jgi:D-alanyl-D-alanine carboxypeptidase
MYVVHRRIPPGACWHLDLPVLYRTPTPHGAQAVRSIRILWCVLTPALVAAQTPAGTSAAQATPRAAIDVRRLDSAVTATMQQRRIPGASIALVRGGRIEVVKAYGFASLEPRVPVDTATRFAIGSVTKQFIASVALLLQEDGVLSLHDTVAKWYPTITRANEITLLDLVNHVSGYHDYYPLDFVDRPMAQPTTAEQIIAKFATAPLDFDPGTRWSYSNTGYTILGRVIERVTGKPLGTLLDERIFQPLGMRQTVFEPTTPDRRASGYVSWALGDPEPALLEGPGWIGAAGGIWSTATDLARWNLALMRPGFLSPASRAVLFGERTLRDGIPTGYAGGIGVARRDGRTIYQHGGATSGFAASSAFVPEDTAAVVVLVNSDQSVVSAVPIDLVSPPRTAVASAPPQRAQPPIPPPTPRGAPAQRAAVDFFRALQRGQVDRSMLGEEYSAFLTPARIASAARSLAPLGAVTKAETLSRWERGGMEVAVVRLSFATRTVSTLMYRTPDGAIQQYLLW